MKEYGGYLPLELHDFGEYYASYAEHLVMLQCGRMAVEYILKDTKIDHLYLPRYLCPSVALYLKDSVKIEFYNIDENFNPVNVRLYKNDYLFWVNFFGIASLAQRKTILDCYKNVIFDNTQAFYAKPFLPAYNIYSCRKFFGVNDGAYLIKEGIQRFPCERQYGYKEGDFLLKSLELGTNAAYSEYQNNEKNFEEKGLREMSVLAQKIMRGIDYSWVAEKRRQNFNTVHNRLKNLNELNISLPEDAVPMVYPLLITREGLRKYLIQNKVYVSQWWKIVLEDEKSNQFEKKLSEFLLPLPIDQRYTEDDMNYVCELIRHFGVKEK